MPRRQLRRASLLVFAACGLLTSPAAPRAQDFAIDGVIVGPDGAPVAGAPVLLHRVTQSGGSMLADTVTGANGRFSLRAAGAPLDGVFFVASRYQGELYVGPMVRAPFSPGVDYVLRVGVPETSVARALEATTTPPAVASSAPSAGDVSRGAGFAIAALALAGAALLVLARRRGAPSEQRRLLIRIAELDERYAGAADPPEHYRTERSRLVRRRLDLSR